MSDPYASHLPILAALCDILQPKRILEFGGGVYSTPVLLSVKGLQRLVSVETDERWRDYLKSSVKPEMFVGEQLADWNLAEWDLIMIDDGQNSAERIATIERVAEAKPPCPVVIHDFEVYQKTAMRLFENGIMIDLLNPATGVVWNGDALKQEQIERLKNALQIN